MKILKHCKFPLLVFVFLAGVIVSCAKEDVPSEDREIIDNNQFPLLSAKALFESKATDLKFVDFYCNNHECDDHSHNHKHTKSNDGTGMNIVPIWENTITIKRLTSIIHQIPMANTGINGAYIFNKSEQSVDISEELEIRSYLVIERSLLKDTTRTFVAISFGAYSGDEKQKEEAFTYYGDKRSFLGYMIISDISGSYIASFRYENGIREQVTMGVQSNSTETQMEFTGIIFSSQERALTRAVGTCPLCGALTSFDDFCFSCVNGLDPITVVGHRPNVDYVDPPWHEPCMFCGALSCSGICGGSGDGGGSGGGDGDEEDGNNNENNDTVDDQFLYVLSLHAEGPGTVSPEGISTYGIQNTTVPITATPYNSLSVFSGWIEDGKLISESYNYALNITQSRCITGVFFLAGQEDCAEILRKFRTNTRLNSGLNDYLRPKIIGNNNHEHGYLSTYEGYKEDQIAIGEGSMNVILHERRKYVELIHSHPKAVLMPSAADLLALYKIITNGYAHDADNFMFVISSADRATSMQVEDMTKFEDLIYGLGLLSPGADMELIERLFGENIFLSRQEMDDIAREDIALKWLFDNDSGLKIVRSTLTDGENKWRGTEYKNGNVLYINCNDK